MLDGFFLLFFAFCFCCLFEFLLHVYCIFGVINSSIFAKG
jgi:hypothetical protein